MEEERRVDRIVPIDQVLPESRRLFPKLLRWPFGAGVVPGFPMTFNPYVRRPKLLQLQVINQVIDEWL